MPNGCFATAAVTDNVLKLWNEKAKPGMLQFKKRTRQLLSKNFSLGGFGRAVGAFANERQIAKKIARWCIDFVYGLNSWILAGIRPLQKALRRIVFHMKHRCFLR